MPPNTNGMEMTRKVIPTARWSTSESAPKVGYCAWNANAASVVMLKAAEDQVRLSCTRRGTKSFGATKTAMAPTVIPNIASEIAMNA